MNVTKAVITAAGARQRHLPLQTIVDAEARSRRLLGLLVDEAKSAGIQEIGLVISPGTSNLYRDAAIIEGANLTFIEQPEPLGYGHAVLTAREFTGDEPFLLMVSDHLYASELPDTTCAAQLVRSATEERCMVSAVQPTHESKLSYFGAIGGNLFENREFLYQVQSVLEKPSPTQAEQEIMTPGLRHGYYLCFLGMHVLTPAIMPLLAANLEKLKGSEPLDLSSSLNDAAQNSRYLAHAIRGRRYDLDHRYGILIAQLALALEGNHREEVLSSIVELLAQKQPGN
ncbi:MAG: sugar phosphate nucleotidyltransferase [Verrucomicrobiales bacterium]|nr:sugar phosphate nucleotidyltransferase [Verrucomicrobiales bacterium]